jgi:hypothetical protein
MRRLIATFTLLLAHASLGATIQKWPAASGVCSTTLQACVDGVAINDTVQIANATVDVGTAILTISKPLRLTGAPGVRPVFVPGQLIVVTYSAPGNWSIQIDGLTLPNGAVTVNANGGNAAILLRNLDITSLDDAHAYTGIGVIVLGATTTAHAEIAENRIRISAPNYRPAVEFYNATGVTTSSVAIHDNRIVADGAIYNRGIDLEGPIAGSAVYANQLRGNLYFGIGVTPYSSATTNANNVAIVSNYIACTDKIDYTQGVSLTTALTGSTWDTEVFNNTVVGCKEGIGVVNTAVMAGHWANNVLADDTNSMDAYTYNDTLTIDHNLIWNATNNFFGADGPTIFDDPKFYRADDDARLTTGSPAIDAGNSDALHAVLVNYGIPEIDADGLRRFKGATNLVDIGAFEFGDASLALKTPAIGGASIDIAQLNGNAAAAPLVGVNQMPDSYSAPATYPYSIGLAFDAANQFEVVSESTGGPPAPQSGYVVFAPGQGTGSLMHTSTNTTIHGFLTEVDDPYLDGHSSRVVFATHRPGLLFNHLIGTVYFSGHWFIEEDDITSGSFPTGYVFDVYAQDPSVNAFTWTVPDGTTVASSIPIDDVMINGEPCAHVMIGNIYDSSPVGIGYANGRWNVVDLTGIGMGSGDTFNVLVDQAGTERCRFDHLFHDGYDG